MFEHAAAAMRRAEDAFLLDDECLDVIIDELQPTSLNDGA